MLFGKQKSHANCKITNTLILCSCHRHPMNYDVKELEKRLKKDPKDRPYCSVCRMIDKIWSKGAIEMLDAYKDKLKASGPLDLLPSFPPLEIIVARTMKVVIEDFNYHGKKYYDSICEEKLKLADEAKTGKYGQMEPKIE